MTDFRAEEILPVLKGIGASEVVRLPLVRAMFPLQTEKATGAPTLQPTNALVDALWQEVALTFASEEMRRSCGKVFQERVLQRLCEQVSLVLMFIGHFRDKYVDEFQAFDVANLYLLNNALRVDYMRTMLSVVTSSKKEDYEDDLKRAHDEWVKENEAPKNLLADLTRQDLLERFPFVKAMFPRTEEFSPTSEQIFEFVKTLMGGIVYGFTDPDSRTVTIETIHCAVRKVIEGQFHLAYNAVHPRRFGDKYANEYEALMTAYQYLQDDDLRLDYLRSMLSTEDYHKEETLPCAHEQWVKAKETQALQDTILNRKPRRLGVHGIDTAKKTAEFTWQPIQPIPVFQRFCHAIVIVISNERRIRIERDEVEKLYNKSNGYYVKTIQFSSFGNFSLHWFAEMNGNGTLYETANSEPIEVHIAHPEQEYALKQRSPLLEMARRKKGELKRELVNFMTHPVALHDRAEVHRRQTLLRERLSSATTTIDELAHILLVLDLTDCQESAALSALKEVHAEALVEEQQLSAALESLDKKANFKSFVRIFSTKLETGEAISWIQQVSNEEIIRQGADANRLYQLLVDNKKNKALIQPSLLQVAAARSDLFQPKQCEALLKRSRASQVPKRGAEEPVSSANPSNSSKSKASAPTENYSYKTASTTKSEQSVSPLTISSSEGDSTKSSGPVKFSKSPGATVTLFQFLQANQTCLKCSPDDFFAWLTSQDVDSLETFWEAFGDNNFVVEMQQNGVKGFKRSTLKENLSASLNVRRAVPSAVGIDGK